MSANQEAAVLNQFWAIRDGWEHTMLQSSNRACFAGLVKLAVHCLGPGVQFIDLLLLQIWERQVAWSRLSRQCTCLQITES